MGLGAALASSFRPHTRHCHHARDPEADGTADSVPGKDMPGKHSPVAPSHSLTPDFFVSFLVKQVK